MRQEGRLAAQVLTAREEGREDYVSLPLLLVLSFVRSAEKCPRRRRCRRRAASDASREGVTRGLRRRRRPRRPTWRRRPPRFRAIFKQTGRTIFRLILHVPTPFVRRFSSSCRRWRRRHHQPFLSYLVGSSLSLSLAASCYSSCCIT